MVDPESRVGKRAAVYPGSFDPPTYGHLDLIERATRIFDHLIVAVATNTAKVTTFPVEERIEMLTEVTAKFANVEITTFTGLTAEYARSRGVQALVRGLRAISDFEFELSMAITNQKLNPDIDTVCLMPSEHYLFLSSNVVREVARFGGDLSPFVPPSVEARLRKKFQNS